MSKARVQAPNFGDVLRKRRRELDLTQDEVASRIKISVPYVGHLESGKRHPSNKIIGRLAQVLGLEYRELFFLANPQAKALLSASPKEAEGSVWDAFRTDDHVRRIHNISNDEMQMLSHVALLGELQSARDLIYILNMVRHAVGT